MCGIAGILSTYSQDKVAVSVLHMMSDKLTHRGPDGSGVWIDPNKKNIGLSFRRLAIIDLSEKGNQPLENEDGQVHLVVNGEIYNFRELRRELLQRRHHFKSQTDSEVIIHAYEEWGTMCIEKFDGMFAFLLWDSAKNLLFGARDRFGEKPLFYSKLGSQFVFASEIKAIVAHPQYRHQVNEKILRAYLAYNDLPSAIPETFYKDVYRILPSQAFTVSTQGDFKKWFYWALELHTPIAKDFLKSVDEFRSLFNLAVQTRMFADVPIGSCLSGGLDSSSIICSIRTLLKQEKLSTFSARSNDPLYDEGPYIKSVVEQVRSNHYEVYPSSENLEKDLERFFYHLEEPYHEMTAYAAYNVYRLAHQANIKVLLDGQGGDELLCGYIEDLWLYLCEVLKTKGVMSFLKERRYIYDIHTLGEGGDIAYLHDFSFRNSIKLIPLIARLIKLKRLMTGPSQKKSEYLPLCEAERVSWGGRYKDNGNNLVDFPLKNRAIQRLTNGEFTRFLDYVDRTSMAHSVEVRLPFLHPKLVDFAINLDCALKVCKGKTKYILRKAMKNVIPDTIHSRIDKKGFSIPQKKWLGFLSNEWIKARNMEYVAPYLLRMPQNADELWRCLSASFVIEGL